MYPISVTKKQYGLRKGLGNTVGPIPKGIVLLVDRQPFLATVVREINLVYHETPTLLEQAIRSFVQYYDYQCYHEVPADVIAFDVYSGPHFQVLQRRGEAKDSTLDARKRHNSTVKEQGFWILNSPFFLGPKRPTFAEDIHEVKVSHFC